MAVGEHQAQPPGEVPGQHQQQVPGGLVHPVQVFDDQNRRPDRVQHRAYRPHQLEPRCTRIGWGSRLGRQTVGQLRQQRRERPSLRATGPNGSGSRN